jgi:peptidylprolyl isomerase
MHKNFIAPTIIIITLLVGGLLVWLHTTKYSNPEAERQAADVKKFVGTYGNEQQDQYNNQQKNAENPGTTNQNSTNQSQTMNNAQTVTVVMKTNKGDITLDLYPQLAPKTVENFVKLAQSGFYNGVKFHRVIKGFMIQGGDPYTKDDSQMARWGTGGPGYTFADEIHAQNTNLPGTIAMANAGPNTNGSQFFINTAENASLNTKHTVFGQVVAGVEIVQAIESTPVDSEDRPTNPVIITSISVK